MALLHVGLTVRNLERSLSFYRDVVGMKETTRYGGERSFDWFDELTHNRGAIVAAAHLRLSEYELQLLEYRAGGDARALELEHRRIGTPHMCFRVDDVEAKRRELEQRGDVDITSPIVTITDGVRSFYTADPDGVPVEFVEMRREG